MTERRSRHCLFWASLCLMVAVKEPIWLDQFIHAAVGALWVYANFVPYQSREGA